MWRKAIGTLALVSIIIACLLACVPNGSNAAVQELGIDYVVDTGKEIEVVLNDEGGSGLPGTISTDYDIQKLESLFSVSAYVFKFENGELNSESEKITIESTDYYLALSDVGLVFNILTLDNASGSLYQDTNKVVFSYDADLEISGGSSITGLSVDGLPETVYTTTTEEELKQFLVVTANLANGTTLPIVDYEIVDFDNRSPTSDLSFSIEYRGVHWTGSVAVEYPQVKSIQDIAVKDGVQIHSSYMNTFITGNLDVTALMTDNKLYLLDESNSLHPVYDFSASNDLYTHANKLEGGVAPVDVTVYTVDHTGKTISKTNELTIVQSTPENIAQVELPRNIKFTATRGISAEDLSKILVHVSFNDNALPKEVLQGITLSYIPVDDAGNELKGSDGNVIEYSAATGLNRLVAGDYHLKVTYTENGESVSNTDAVPFGWCTDIQCKCPQMGGEHIHE